MKPFESLLAYRELIKNLVYRDLKIKYKQSLLGILWSLLNPLLMLVIYSFAFQYIMRIPVEGVPFTVFFMVALLPWNFLAGSLSLSVSSVVDNSGLIQKVYFPREILPLSIVLSNLVQFLLTLVIFFPAFIYYKVTVTEKILLLPVMILFQTVFIIGLCYIFALLFVFFRDMKHIVEVLLTIWFWLTPIIYPITMVQNKPEIMPLYMLNPMTVFIQSYRNILLYNTWPTANMFLRMVVAAAGTFLIGRWLFRSFENRFTELS